MRKTILLLFLIAAAVVAFGAEIVGRVYLDRANICLAMLSAGFAWHYVQYDKTPEYAAAEKKARAGRVGLWCDTAPPVPPWEFRRAGREK